MAIEHYFILSAILFCIGMAVIITKKNAIVVLMGVELILNAANINFIAISQLDNIKLGGQFFALFVIVVAAAEAAVGLAIILKIYKYFSTTNLDEINQLKG
ncbi:NADH-quinone oxidoreductase subunit NuoK [Fulvivirga kasyanovii]|uniref:NADH-quinone oxidoreductase subunit K n=1 Tax=Fulvivirga kasyanovii TaxID=396812 RepID=A0ABW9RNU9_9BACT|nr:MULTISPECIES: NADH-quinone oxidoreductase subunit NuoK [Fulvivirga]MTI25422.1 NADH-quinone oxidoreductase subunit NuoK [Fulvivirga kasyanovii]UII30075.1 NADH-quinone oxidoreductase subunit NuoK [Fulvivirga ulvae]